MDDEFAVVLEGLRNGDFTRLAPVFLAGSGPAGRSRIAAWHEEGRFDQHPDEAAEALTCACFLGERETAEYLIVKGLDPSGGARSGMNAVHWAANRGQVETLRLLLRHRVPLEIRNMYGGTVLGQTVWSAVHQPGPGQLEAIAELLRAGADVTAVAVPTGNPRVDAVLSRGSRS
jgi:hypothetical protein